MNNLPLSILAAATLLFWLGVAVEVMRGNRRMRRLAALDSPAPPAWPRVTVIFAARNEGATLGAAVPTMLALDYPDFELIAVNDRSEDDTGAVLEKIAATDPRLRVAHIRELPPGWLGKNHALHHAAARATGEWILFTDADIHFHPAALRRAIAHATAHHLDQLSAVPELHGHGPLLGLCVNAFGLLFAMFLFAWRIPDPRSKAHGGVGAFNLVRAATYRKLGGHEPLRLRPDDDIKLGKLFKLRGARCEMMHGAGALSVAWYPSTRAMIQGLTKNAFAALDYRVALTLAVVIFYQLFFQWPVLALFLLGGPAWWLNLAAVLVLLGLSLDAARFNGGAWWHAFTLPLGLMVLSYVMLRSMTVTLWTRGITWRGTHYPLRELKANRL
jgi:glycosyltransferase involved in cell wall biosynthesis